VSTKAELKKKGGKALSQIEKKKEGVGPIIIKRKKVSRILSPTQEE